MDIEAELCPEPVRQFACPNGLAWNHLGPECQATKDARMANASGGTRPLLKQDMIASVATTG
ncbi:hypothetical protein X743_30075 [Mesorhizobium sp. LNHC252B00]|nr:hypothetical protein X743_30075 [Mesorhizobium sp. LNHC252B00]